MIAVALIVVILAVIAVVAAVVWRRRKQDVGFVSRERASTHTSSFENPLYDSSAPQKSDAIHAAGDTSGYMDVPVDSSGDTSGYMDVPADANEDASGYMDVPPEDDDTGGGHAEVEYPGGGYMEMDPSHGFDDDEEEV